MKKMLAILTILFPICFTFCEKPVPEVPTPEPAEIPVINLLAPQDGVAYSIETDASYTFQWENIEGQVAYKVNFSLSADMKNSFGVAALKNPLVITGAKMDDYAKSLGIGASETRTIYWNVSPWDSSMEAKCEVRSFSVTRLAEVTGPLDNADPIKVKVAVVYEDQIYSNPGDPRDGKRIHEIRHWNDPFKQVKDYERYFEEISHGVVDIEIVKEIESEKIWCYNVATSAGGKKDYCKIDTLINYMFDNDIDGKGLAYDYVGMMQYFGLDKDVDNGDVTEIWVYNHPSCKMNESRLIGPGAFWCNSMGIAPPVATNTINMVCVMFCNYERTVDLALHSFGHRFESMMRPIYGEEDRFNDYSDKPKRSDLTMFELFCGRFDNYGDKYDKGRAHLGICHFPCNADYDYDYSDPRYVETYADEWDNYPNIPMKTARRVNCSEWSDAGGYQMGYMKWWLGHIPHFKGINPDPKDLHLNNWWYYLFDYKNAVSYERTLRQELE